MNLKQRFSLIFSLIFTILLGTVLFILYTLFSNYRKDEFQETLTETGETTLNLVMEINKAGHELSREINNNSIIKLYNARVLIFDHSLQLVYSSQKDKAINWSVSDLNLLARKDNFYRLENNIDYIGMRRMYGKENFYILVSAEDKFGISKLNYLKYLLIAAYLISCFCVWALSFYLSHKSLEPLDRVTKKIQEITENNLNSQLEESGRNDEVSALSHSFNKMLERINKSFSYQKEFVGNASHELRTPIARITTQLENLVTSDGLSPGTINVLNSIIDDSHQLSDVVSSLLVLSRIENRSFNFNASRVRIDEIIFSCAEYLRKIYPDFKIYFEIQNESLRELDVEVRGDESLLKIAFNNLLKNAFTYSDNSQAKILVRQYDEGVDVIITNSGPVPDTGDTSELFNVFTRGSNAQQSKGLGLGLGIAQRIMQYHNAVIRYLIPDKNTNQVIASFSNPSAG